MCQISSKSLFPNIQTCKFCLCEGLPHINKCGHRQFHRPLSSKVVYSTLPQHTHSIGEHSPFLLHRGFFQSVRPISGQLMMNIDVTTGVMFKGGPMIQVCMEILGINNIRDLHGQQKRDILRRFLKNLTFKMIRPIRGGREKVYRITDIVGPASDIRFQNQENEEITIVVCRRFCTNKLIPVLTSASRIISGALSDPFSFHQSTVSKLARKNSSSLWSFVNSSLANNSRS